MALLSKKQILEADDLRYVIVPVPEWGGEVRVGTLSGAQRLDYEDLVQARQEGGARTDTVAVLIAASLVDEAGAPLGFTPEDVEALGRKSVKALRRVFDAALELNVLSKAAAEKTKGE